MVLVWIGLCNLWQLRNVIIVICTLSMHAAFNLTAKSCNLESWGVVSVRWCDVLSTLLHVFWNMRTRTYLISTEYQNDVLSLLHARSNSITRASNLCEFSRYTVRLYANCYWTTRAYTLKLIWRVPYVIFFILDIYYMYHDAHALIYVSWNSN